MLNKGFARANGFQDICKNDFRFSIFFQNLGVLEFLRPYLGHQVINYWPKKVFLLLNGV